LGIARRELVELNLAEVRTTWNLAAKIVAAEELSL
jgi:hypothetical protein